MDKAFNLSLEDKPHGPIWTLSGSLRHGLIDHAVSERPRSYPAATAHYGECTYMTDQFSSSPAQDLRNTYLSTSGFTHQDTSARTFDAKKASKKSSDYISRIEYERVVNENLQLSQELRKTKDDAERANEAVRGLAAWAYHERDRLIRELEKEQSANKHDIEEVVRQEGLLYNQAASSFLAQEVNNARNEVGLPPLSLTDMGIRLGLRKPPKTNVIQTRQADTHDRIKARFVKYQMSDREDAGSAGVDGDGEGYESITDQVDALIAEEMGRLPGVH